MDEDGEKKEEQHHEDMKVENKDNAAKETVETETPSSATPSKRVAIDAPPTLLVARPPDPTTLQDKQSDVFETSSPREGGGGSSKWCLLFFAILLLAAIGMLGYAINYLRDNDNNNGSRGGRVNPIDGSPRDPQSSQPPSLVPSPMSSSTPTLTAAATFNSIANAPGARRLQRVSNCDDCEEQVDLPFRFNWRGSCRFAARQITVSSDGYLNFECGVGFGFVCAEVWAAKGDLNPSARGDVWIQWKQDARRRTDEDDWDCLEEEPNEGEEEGGLVISWENVSLVSDPQSSINAQVTLFANGAIEICWGESNKRENESLMMGAYDFERNEIYPADQRPGFDSDGIVTYGWPSNRCQRFFQAPPPAGQFTSIAGITGAVRLDRISSCDDCEEVVHKFVSPFYWLGRYPVFSFWVSANGRIRVDDCDRGERESCFLVNVAQADLNPARSVGGAVWAHDASDRSPQGPLIISWEGVPFFGSADTYIEAQASFFNNGDIDICWGDSTLEEYHKIMAGVSDTNTGRYFPASGYPFDSSGMTRQGSWPSYQCQRFSITESV